MKYSLVVENFRGGIEQDSKAAAAERIMSYLANSGDTMVDDGPWDYRVLVQEQHAGLKLEGLRIEWPWTFRVTVIQPHRWDVRWREAGDVEIDRGATFSLDGVVEIELESFLRERRAAAESARPHDRRTHTTEGRGGSDEDGGHVFISYVSEDSKTIDRLQADLEAAGIEVWRDRTSLEPGERWKDAIRRAIASGSCFLSCFSSASAARSRSYMSEELTLAVEELRVRSRDRTWFLPVVIDDGEVPDWPIGAGETLRDFNYVSLTPDTWTAAVERLATAIRGRAA